jgi:ubiquinone biosynthesis protein UbiJ
MNDFIMSQVSRAMTHAFSHSDPSARCLKRLNHSSLLCCVHDSPVTVLITVEAAVIDLKRVDGHHQANTVLQGPARAWMGLLQTKGVNLPVGLSVSGDLAVLSLWRQLMRDSEIDWAGVWAPVFGDLHAHDVVTHVGRMSRWLQQAVRHRLLDVREYCQEEVEALPAPVAVARWMSDVDRCRDDVARLRARIDRLFETRRTHV